MKPELAETEACASNMSQAVPPALDDALRVRARRDRRGRLFFSLMYGSFNPRRRIPRRTGARVLGDIDWHHPQWLAVAIVIVVLSCVDAGLTLTLIQQGAYEANPLMAPLVNGSALAFTLTKVGLTAGGVVLLTLVAGVRAFGRIPVSLLLYAVLAGYTTLVFYEYRLLGETLLTF